jgi:hypothetical protein
MRPPEGQYRRGGEESDRRQPSDHRAAKPQTPEMGLKLLGDERVWPELAI